MKIKNDLINLAKIENTIAQLFYKLSQLESSKEDNEKCYDQNINLLSEAIIIENKYLRKVYEYVCYTTNTFGTDPLKYVITELGYNYPFISKYYDNNTIEDILEQYLLKESRKKLDYNNIFSKFLSTFSENKYQNISKDLEYTYKQDIKIKNNIIYKRIMYSLDVFKYNKFKEEIISNNFYDEITLSNICVLRDKTTILVNNINETIKKLQNEDNIKNKQIIRELKYYKYVELFKYNLFKNEIIMYSHYPLLKYELYHLFNDKEYVNKIYIDHEELDIDSIIEDISNKIEQFSDDILKSKKLDMLPKEIFFILNLKAKISLLGDKTLTEDYCNKISNEFLIKQCINIYSNSSIILNHINSAISEVLENSRNTNKTYNKIL